jgi:hypothetical protein
MATTTNYGWTTPDDTALVKDGASAIRTLGSSIDTSLNTALGTKKAGLVLLNTTSFSGVSSQSVNDVFSTTYDSYKIISTGTQTTARPSFRLRVSGADATGSNYEFCDTAGNTSTNTAFIPINGTGQWWISFDLINPFLAEATRMLSLAGNATNALRFSSSRHNLTNSYTGLTILPEGGSGTVTGSISIYGYNK